MSKIILSLSGGMDSATLLGIALQEGHEVQCVGFRYGSKHGKHEIAAAKKLAEKYGVPFDILNLSAAFSLSTSDLLNTGGDIPEGHYQEASMTRTVVPGRNIVFASILAGIAWSRKAEEVWLGIHAGDHHIYPDCRPEFYAAMRDAVFTGTDSTVKLVAPFLHLTKAEILKRGLEIAVPYELTRTCYKDKKKACGVCGSCQERLEAFHLNGKEDPLPYESRTLLPKGEAG